MKFLLLFFSCIFKLTFDVIELVTFPQIGVNKGSQGKKIDFAEQVLACHFTLELYSVFFINNFEALITSLKAIVDVPVYLSTVYVYLQFCM